MGETCVIVDHMCLGMGNLADINFVIHIAVEVIYDFLPILIGI